MKKYFWISHRHLSSAIQLEKGGKTKIFYFNGYFELVELELELYRCLSFGMWDNFFLGGFRIFFIKILSLENHCLDNQWENKLLKIWKINWFPHKLKLSSYFHHINLKIVQKKPQKKNFSTQFFIAAAA